MASEQTQVEPEVITAEHRLLLDAGFTEDEIDALSDTDAIRLYLLAAGELAAPSSGDHPNGT